MTTLEPRHGEGIPMNPMIREGDRLDDPDAIEGGIALSLEALAAYEEDHASQT